MSRVIVVGGGIAGLVAAYEANRAGFSVTIFEANEKCGGLISSLTLAGSLIDSGAESFAITRPETLQLIHEIGLTNWLVYPERSDARIHTNGEFYLIPQGMMGIPSDLLDRETVAILGLEQARLSLSLDSFPWNIDQEKTLGEIVEKRMGKEVVDKIVNPITAGVHATDSYQLEMESLLPGLLDKAKEMNSLSMAVKELRGCASRPGSPVAGINGGINLIITTLQTLLIKAGVEIYYNHPVDRITLDQKWHVNVGENSFTAEEVVVAVPPHVATHLLVEIPEVSERLAMINPIDVALVFMAIKSKELSKAPLGSGVLVSEVGAQTVAKGSTHVTAKWKWLKDQVGAEVEIIRLSYGRNGVVSPDNEYLLKVANNDVKKLYGLKTLEIIDAEVVRWPHSLIQAKVGHGENIEHINQLLGKHPGLHVIGSAMSGNGIAGIISHTRKVMKGLTNV